MAAPLTLRSLYLDLTRTVEISNNFLTVDPIPPITSAMIQNFTIVNEDISSSADISGSKIADASIPLSKIENIDGQSFTDYLSALGLPDYGTVTSDMIVDGSIMNIDICDGQITTEKIADGTIMNADISSNADISGSKIQAATDTNAGVVTTSQQTFGGLKIFRNGASVGGVFSSSGNTTLENPLPILFRSANDDDINECRRIDVFVKNTHATAPGALIIKIPIAASGSPEASSYFEVTLIGTQPITAVNTAGGVSVVQAAAPLAYTTRCIITVTGIEVTTTLFGKTNNVDPLVATALKKFSGDGEFATNLMIAVGCRRYTAYHLTGFRSGAEPTIYYVTRPGSLPNSQEEADQFLANTLILY